MEPTAVTQYLGGRILASDALYKIKKVGSANVEFNCITYIWTELEVTDTTGNVLAMWVIKMSIQDLLRKRQWPLQPSTSQKKEINLKNGAHT